MMVSPAGARPLPAGNKKPFTTRCGVGVGGEALSPEDGDDGTCNVRPEGGDVSSGGVMVRPVTGEVDVEAPEAAAAAAAAVAESSTRPES